MAVRRDLDAPRLQPLRAAEGVGAEDPLHLPVVEAAVEQRRRQLGQVGLAIEPGHHSGDTVHVGADCEVLRTHHLGDVSGMSHQIADAADTEATGSVGPESDHTAGRRDRLQLVVGQVAGEVLQCTGAGVRRHHGGCRHVDDAQQGGPVGMGDVHQHAELVHAFDDPRAD